MSLRKHALLWLALALVAIGASAAIWKQRSAPAAATPAATTPVVELLPADVTTVRRQTLRRTLPLTGALQAISQASVKARVGGEVREVRVRQGDTVTAGQVLIVMDISEYNARLAQAKGALTAARAQLDIAVKTRDNNRALLEKGFISKNAFDNTSSQYDVARANVDTARGAFDVAQKALNDTVIRAPIAGQVSGRTVEPGEKVSPDNKLIDIVDLRRLEMEAYVPAADIGGVAVGQEVSVRIEGFAEPFSGKVTRINPATQAGSRSVAAWVGIDNPQQVLRAGLFGEAQLTLSRKENVLAAPPSAIQQQAGTQTVHAIVDGRLTRQTVTTGMTGIGEDGPATEIVNGLNEGMRIVRANLGALRPGATVVFAKTAPGISPPSTAAAMPTAAPAAKD